MLSSFSTRSALFTIAGLLVLPLAGAIWFGLVDTSPLPLDSAWHGSVNIAPKTFPYFIAVIFHFLGSTKGMAAVSALILVVLLVIKQWWHAAVISASMLSVLVASKVIKLIVDRPRPEDMLVLETATSFPSGHSLGAGAIATVLVIFVLDREALGKTEKVVTIVFGSLYILTMMWSRTALKVHWLSDTVAGALLGVAIAMTFSLIFLPRAQLNREGQVRHSVEFSKHTV